MELVDGELQPLPWQFEDAPRARALYYYVW